MNKKERHFVDTVLRFYQKNGRHTLPWRKTKSPYHILVSELMLQQTQVERVIPKYQSFIKKWPTCASLADSKLADVLMEWQGLGYNRRAKFLWECANAVVRERAGVFPKYYKELQKLPGIGPYTAGAVLAFAYNVPVPIIETNIRTVIIHHFFPKKENISEDEILRVVERTLPESNVRVWYAALMDYGSYLKRAHGNKNIQSSSYLKQSAFKGSNREVRGTIVRLLAQQNHISQRLLYKKLDHFPKERVITQLNALIREGLVIKTKSSYSLP